MLAADYLDFRFCRTAKLEDHECTHAVSAKQSNFSLRFSTNCPDDLLLTHLTPSYRFRTRGLGLGNEMEKRIYYCAIWLSLEMKKKQTMTFWCAKVTQRHVTFQLNGNLRFEKLRSSVTLWWEPILSLKSWSLPTVVRVWPSCWMVNRFVDYLRVNCLWMFVTLSMSYVE